MLKKLVIIQTFHTTSIKISEAYKNIRMGLWTSSLSAHDVYQKQYFHLRHTGVNEWHAQTFAQI